MKRQHQQLLRKVKPPLPTPRRRLLQQLRKMPNPSLISRGGLWVVAPRWTARRCVRSCVSVCVVERAARVVIRRKLFTAACTSINSSCALPQLLSFVSSWHDFGMRRLTAFAAEIPTHSSVFYYFCLCFSLVYLLYQSKPNVKSAFDFPVLDAAANAPPTNKSWGSSGGASSGGAMNGSSSSGGERPKLNLAKSTVERAKTAPASPGATPAAASASEVRLCLCLMPVLFVVKEKKLNAATTHATHIAHTSDESFAHLCTCCVHFKRVFTHPRAEPLFLSFSPSDSCSSYYYECHS